MQRRLAIVLAAIAVAAAGLGSATAPRPPGLPPATTGGIKDGG